MIAVHKGCSFIIRSSSADAVRFKVPKTQRLAREAAFPTALPRTVRATETIALILKST